MSGFRTTIVRDMSTHLPDAVRRFHPSQNLVVTEVWYEELIVGRVWNDLMRM